MQDVDIYRAFVEAKKRCEESRLRFAVEHMISVYKGDELLYARSGIADVIEFLKGYRAGHDAR